MIRPAVRHFRIAAKAAKSAVPLAKSGPQAKAKRSVSSVIMGAVRAEAVGSFNEYDRLMNGALTSGVSKTVGGARKAASYTKEYINQEARGMWTEYDSLLGGALSKSTAQVQSAVSSVRKAVGGAASKTLGGARAAPGAIRAGASWTVRESLDPISKGMFLVGTAPFAALGYPVMAVGGTVAKLGARAGKAALIGAGKGVASYARALAFKGPGGTRRANYVAAGVLGIAGVGIGHHLGTRINKKMRERDQYTMGLTTALHRVHG